MISGEDSLILIFFRQGKIFLSMQGFQRSFYHRGFNLENAVFPDQIDPLAGIMYPTSEALAI